MRLIVDSNIVFSGLLKPDSRIADFLFNPGHYELYAPSFLKEEIFSKTNRLVELTGLQENVLTEAFRLLSEKISFQELEVCEDQMEEAFYLVKDIDKNDVFFVALTLAMAGSHLLTGDKKLAKGLIKKGFSRVLTVKDLKLS